MKTAKVTTLTGDLIHTLLVLVALAILAWDLAYYAAMARYIFVDTHMNDFGR